MQNKYLYIKWYFVFIIFFLNSCRGINTHKDKIDIDSYNIRWESPSANSSESMPVGGGDIGCNVWVEDGNILVYAQRSGSFSENGEYLKLGRFRLDFSPNPFLNPDFFSQELILEDGYILIKGKENKSEIAVKIWVDIFTHSIHFDIQSEKEIHVKATYESWRTEDKEVKEENNGRFGCFALTGYPGKVIRKKDIINFEDNSVLFYHHNDKHTLSPDVMIAQQGLDEEEDKIVNNIRYLASGGKMYGENFYESNYSQGVYLGTPYKGWTLESKEPQKTHHLIVATHIQQTENIAEWKKELENYCKNIEKTQGNKKHNKEWWNEFWKKSWIITDPLGISSDTAFWEMGRNYQLMRFQLGCNLYGEYPSKFNGSNFTFDPCLVNEKMLHDPDWRQWGGDMFTAQNQRLLYWPMLKSGDFDGMKSQFNLYEWGLNGAIAKVKKSFGHAGGLYCEYANATGVDIGSGWGWTEGKTRVRGKEIPFGDPRANASRGYNDLVEEGVMANPFISYHWESQVEHAYMILEYHRFTEVNIDNYMPFIKNALIFFDEHYQKRQIMRDGNSVDRDGKLVLFPSTSCETYRGAKNPVDLVAGLYASITALLSLESNSLSIQEKNYYKEYLGRLPEFSYDTIDGDRIIKPAESYMHIQNIECPQFYPLFPFNCFNIKSEEIPTFKNTWKHGEFRKNMIESWHQDGIFYARMGMKEEAFNYNMKKLASSSRRFPTFWGPGHDWVPDHNWGGSGMIGLQEMLLQTIGDKIYIFPTWPEGKDVHFKLHAPQNTSIEVKYINGKIETLKVFPEHRKKDIEILIENY